MKTVQLRVEDIVYQFYSQVGRRAGLSTEKVMADALFKLAGELSLNALWEKERKNGPQT